MSRPVGAIDLGGTKILTAVVDTRGTIVASVRRPTEARSGVDSVLGRMLASLEDAVASAGLGLSELGRIGVSVAGAIDASRGVVAEAPNLEGWSDVPLAAM